MYLYKQSFEYSFKDSLSELFGRSKFPKKGSRNTYFFLLMKLSYCVLMQFCVTKNFL